MSSQNHLKHVRLELARSSAFPEGSHEHGYDLVIPLDKNGILDTALWRTNKDECLVRRFRPGEPDRLGRLVRKPGGSDHARWIFDYDRSQDDDDETGFQFSSHRFVPGEYLTLHHRRGDQTFKVVRVSEVGSRL